MMDVFFYVTPCFEQGDFGIFLLILKIISMKTQYIILSFLFILFTSFTINAQKVFNYSAKKESLKVWGDCSMCKKRIELAAKNTDAQTAVWDEESKMILVSFNTYKPNTVKIQQAITTAGYETKDLSATSEAYNNLPECCHYDRKQTVKQQTANCCNKEMKCSKDGGCCTDGKCDKANSNCKDMAVCIEKGGCKS